MIKLISITIVPLNPPISVIKPNTSYTYLEVKIFVLLKQNVNSYIPVLYLPVKANLDYTNLSVEKNSDTVSGYGFIKFCKILLSVSSTWFKFSVCFEKKLLVNRSDVNIVSI